MKQEFELKIAEVFPSMCREKNADEQLEEYGRISNLYDAFGCDFADGWFEVIAAFAVILQRRMEKRGCLLTSLLTK